MKGEFYQMEYEAWDEGTDELSLEQEAAYLRLCHQMYRRHSAVPENTATLARLWRCHPNKARKLLIELIDAGKVGRTADGLIDAAIVDMALLRQGDPRRPLPPSIRVAVFARDGRVCRYCNDKGGPHEIDHIFPVARGGDDDPDNLAVACWRCNRRKGAKLLEEWA